MIFKRQHRAPVNVPRTSRSPHRRHVQNHNKRLWGSYNITWGSKSSKQTTTTAETSQQMVNRKCAQVEAREWEREIPIRAFDEEMAAFKEIETQPVIAHTGKAGLSGNGGNVVG